MNKYLLYLSLKLHRKKELNFHKMLTRCDVSKMSIETIEIDNNRNQFFFMIFQNNENREKETKSKEKSKQKKLSFKN